MNKEPTWPNLYENSSPERMREEGVFIRGAKAFVGDEVIAIPGIGGSEDMYGKKFIIEDITAYPDTEKREIVKKIKLKGISGEFNPMGFEKVS